MNDHFFKNKQTWLIKNTAVHRTIGVELCVCLYVGLYINRRMPRVEINAAGVGVNNTTHCVE